MKKKFRDFLLILLSFAIFFELFFILFDKYYLQPKKIPDLLFQQINDLSKKVHHLRRINTDKKIMMNEFKQNNNYLIYDEFLKFDKKKTNILIQGDSWIEFLRQDKNKDYFLKLIDENKFGLISSGTSSHSPSLMSTQQNILIENFNIKPDILIAYIDQTDIGDELCRYRDKISIKNNKIIIPYDKKKYNYFNDYFFIERQKIIRSENLNFFRFIKLINYTFNYNLAKNKKSECSIDNILEPLNKLDIEDANYFIKTLEKFINVSKQNKIEKIILISHPHKNHLNQTYSVNVKNLIDLYLKQIKEDLDINHYYINNFKYSKSISIFRENDQASHLNQAGYENFIDQIIDIINLETK